MRKKLNGQQTVLKTLIKKQDIKLENSKRECSVANSRLEKARSQLSKKEQIINELSDLLYRSLSDEHHLSLDKIDSLRQYLSLQENEKRSIVENYVKHKKQTDELTIELRKDLLNKKGLQKTLIRKSNLVKQEISNKQQNELEDNWLSRLEMKR